MLRNRKIVYAAIVGFLLIVAFVLPPLITRKAKGVVRSSVAPVQRGSSGLGRRLSEAGAAIRGIGGMAEKKRELEIELLHAQAELGKLRDVEAENIRMRRAFDFYRKSAYQMIPCEVIGRDISGWWKSVRIGKGSEKGVGENHAVISPDGLVGKTAQVSKRSSQVLLVCDPACRVSAKVAKINAFGLVRGSGTDLKGQPKARIDFINKDAEVRVGDEVVTSGLAGERGVFPEGIRIGFIEKVYRDESGLYQSAELAPSATGSLLETVFVIGAAEEVRP